eukprot:scaffold144430_cov32-Tisochrysis_lutea.AAC.1
MGSTPSNCGPIPLYSERSPLKRREPRVSLSRGGSTSEWCGERVACVRSSSPSATSEISGSHCLRVTVARRGTTRYCRRVLSVSRGWTSIFVATSAARLPTKTSALREEGDIGRAALSSTPHFPLLLLLTR